MWMFKRNNELKLHKALAQKQPIEVIRQIIVKDPQSVSRKDSAGWTPLHTAAQYDLDKVEVVQLLIDKCPWRALEEKTHLGFTPLHIAAQNAKSVEVVRLLVDNCPQALWLRDIRGATPLHWAAKRNNVEVVQLLINKGPTTLEVRDTFGWMPLHFAAADAKSVEVVQLLIDKRPKVLEERDNAGRMPLHVAAQASKSVEVVQRLIDTCPEALTVENKKGKRPIDMAREREDDDDDKKEEIVALLEGATRRHEQSAGPTGPTPAVLSPTQPPTMAAAPPTVSDDPHMKDRERIKKVVDHTNCEPVAVSGAYLKSILTDKGLGEGFFGTVYKGVDPILGHEFAIKSIHTEILRGGSPQELEAAIKTFRTEQEALSRFRHPNIAALFAYTDPLAEGGVSGGYHLVYELAEKGSLDKFLSDDLGRSRLGSFSRRVQIAIDVLTAIQFLHKGSKEIGSCFHRDIKSANIVLKRDFTAQLIDCGLAKFVNDDIKTSGMKGTKGYTCPQYLQSIEYVAACDIYSFGVVLLELWNGKLQNCKDESGATFNFGEEYIHEDRDVNTDADAAMDLGDPLPMFAKRYTNLALRCINDRIKKRPSGDAVLNELKDILVDCSSLRGDKTVLGVAAARPSNSEPTEACSTCRTRPIVPMHDICDVCLHRAEVRALSKQIEALGRHVSQKIDNVSHKIDNVSHKIDATLPVMAQLDLRLNNPIPRTFLLLPADLKSGWKHPRSWLRSKAQKKFCLYFVCAASQVTVSPPIKLMITKDWVKKVAPVLATALFLLQVAVKAGLSVNLDLDGAASDLFHVSSSHIAEILREVVSILDEVPDSRGLLDRLKAQKISAGDVKELSGDAYELVIEKATEDRRWRSQMESVRVPPSPQVFWVTKAVAQDPKYGYEIVRA